MIVVDAGNSRLKWARIERGQGLGESRAWSNPSSDKELRARLDDDWGRLPAAQSVVVGCVNSDVVVETIADWVHVRWFTDARRLISPADGHGLVNAYAEPATLGVDRWAAMIAARRRYSGELLVVDCGTAITIDAVTGAGQHLGGLIMPGVGLMKAVLRGGTTQIADDRATLVENFSATTGGGVHSGIVSSIASLIDARRRALGVLATIVVTGGDAELVLSALKSNADLQQDLVLEGLALMGGADF